MQNHVVRQKYELEMSQLELRLVCPAGIMSLNNETMRGGHSD